MYLQHAFRNHGFVHVTATIGRSGSSEHLGAPQLRRAFFESEPTQPQPNRRTAGRSRTRHPGRLVVVRFRRSTLESSRRLAHGLHLVSTVAVAKVGLMVDSGSAQRDLESSWREHSRATLSFCLARRIGADAPADPVPALTCWEATDPPTERTFPISLGERLHDGRPHQRIVGVREVRAHALHDS